MPGVLGTCDLGTVDAARWSGVTAQLLQTGRPLLGVARISGQTVSLGRYQRSDSVRSPAVRRWTGGRSIVLDEGMLAAALALPHRTWLAVVPAARLLNRAVRGFLSGLGALGAGAYYFGRDFITVDSSQAAYLSFEIAPSGAALVECVFAAEAHWWIPAEWDALPPRAPQQGVPGPGLIRALQGVSSAQLLSACAQGFSQRFGLTSAPDEAPLPSAPPLPEPPPLPRRSRLHEVPIGFVEASADFDGEVIRAASFNGDFLADSAGVLAAQEAVVGARPTLAELGPRLNGVYANQAHTVLGVKDLTVWAESLIEACT